MKKVQDSKILGYTTIEGKQVPIVRPEVHERGETQISIDPE